MASFFDIPPGSHSIMCMDDKSRGRENVIRKKEGERRDLGLRICICGPQSVVPSRSSSSLVIRLIFGAVEIWYRSSLNQRNYSWDDVALFVHTLPIDFTFPKVPSLLPKRRYKLIET